MNPGSMTRSSAMDSGKHGLRAVRQCTPLPVSGPGRPRIWPEDWEVLFFYPCVWLQGTGPADVPPSAA